MFHANKQVILHVNIQYHAVIVINKKKTKGAYLLKWKLRIIIIC